MTVENVVLITVDSLRADALGQEGVSPVLDDLAEEGVVFDNAVAHGNWTPFSFPSLHGSRPVFAEGPAIGVASTPTLAERLSAAGVDTAGFNAANGFLTDHWGYDRGFDEFDAFVDSTGFGRFLAAHPTIQAWVQLGLSPVRRLATRLRGGDDDKPFTDVSRLNDIEARATEFLARTDDRFFLWLHYMDTHTPYIPAPRHLREVSDQRLGVVRMLGSHLRTGLGWDVDEGRLATLRTLYDGTVRQVDESVGRLQDALAEAGVADETALVVAGDHGEEFLDHGHLSHYPKLYRELTEVPYIVRLPDGPSRRVSEPVGLETVAPTVCELLDVEPAPEWEGTSVVPAVEGEQLDPEPVVSVAVRGETVTSQPIPRRLDDGELLVSVRDERFTYIEHTDSGRRELYDRQTDPSEHADLCAGGDAPEGTVERLASIAADHADRLGEGPDEVVEESDEIAARLRALGYQ